MKESSGFLDNDNVYRGLNVIDYNDYGNFATRRPNYRGIQRQFGDPTKFRQLNSAEERIQKTNILDDQFSTSSLFGFISESNSSRKQFKSYVKIVSFDDLKTETETYLRKGTIPQSILYSLYNIGHI